MKRIIKLITNNFSYKILAVLIAIFLWFFAHSEKTTQITLKIPILLNNLPSDEVVINDVPRYIEVTLSGPSSDVFSYADSKPLYKINLMKTGVGNYIFNISPSEFNLPSGVKIESIYPSSINISLDRIISRVVDVGVSVVGNPEANYELKGIVTEPDKVTVIGPSTIINNINVIMTVPVDISKFKNTIALMVLLSTSNYRMITVQPQAIVVIFKIKHL